jgi:hypothetical protein
VFEDPELSHFESSLAMHGASRIVRRRPSWESPGQAESVVAAGAASTVADGRTGTHESRCRFSTRVADDTPAPKQRFCCHILPADGRPSEIVRQSAAHSGTTFSILECGTGQRCSMTTVKHRSSGIDVGSRLAFGALFLAFMGIMGTMLQTCSSVLVNLPHR